SPGFFGDRAGRSGARGGEHPRTGAFVRAVLVGPGAGPNAGGRVRVWFGGDNRVEDPAVTEFSDLSRQPSGRHSAVVGLQWGDEGKGKLVDRLAGRFDAVVRYNGGANAGQ